MGSFTSKQFEDLLEESVPGTPVSGKRMLEYDPRSPTVGISRTPIQVEKTPERLVDPRSPTIGISRTPILNAEEDGNSIVSNTSSLRQRRYSASASEGSPVKLDPQIFKEALAFLPPLDLDLDIDDATDSVQLLKRSNSEPELNKVMDLPKEETQREVSKTPGKAAQPKKIKTSLFQANTNVMEKSKDAPRSPLRILGDSHQRSPLAKRNVDVNSPLSIVKRKQATKLGMLRSKGNTPVKSAGNSPCRFEAMTADDKENVSI